MTLKSEDYILGQPEMPHKCSGCDKSIEEPVIYCFDCLADIQKEVTNVPEQEVKNFKGNIKWLMLKSYLQEEVANGKTEFRVSFHTGNKFIIHPISKDGKTMDFEF
jgi:hypothetical protein